MSTDSREDATNGRWIKCAGCGEIIYSGELSRNYRICPKCNYYFPLNPDDRIAALIDEESLIKLDTHKHRDESHDWAIIAGKAVLAGHSLIIASVNLGFANGRVGQFVCDMIIKSINQSIDQHLPLVMIYTDSDRPNSSAFFPGQALSIGATIGRFDKEKLLYVSLLSSPHSHSHFPGFALTADIVIAESNPSAIVDLDNKAESGKAIQAAQLLFKNGMADMLIPRKELRHALDDILNFFY